MCMSLTCRRILAKTYKQKPAALRVRRAFAFATGLASSYDLAAVARAAASSSARSRGA